MNVLPLCRAKRTPLILVTCVTLHALLVNSANVGQAEELSFVESLSVSDFNDPNDVFGGEAVDEITFTATILDADVPISPFSDVLRSNFSTEFRFVGGDKATYSTLTPQVLGYAVTVISLESVEFGLVGFAPLQMSLIDSTSATPFPATVDIDVSQNAAMYDVVPAYSTIAGIYAQLDTQRGVWKAPAGLPNPGFSMTVTDNPVATITASVESITVVLVPEPGIWVMLSSLAVVGICRRRLRWILSGLSHPRAR